MIDYYIAEFIGTFFFFIRCWSSGQCKSKNTIAEGQSPWVLITSAWGFAVFVGVFITDQFSGAHLNPAVTLGPSVAEKFSWALSSRLFNCAGFGSYARGLDMLSHLY